ncbi:MAG: hypothetical protein H7338_20125 [Candidatus Sericytochromatia bacterium]|nr:hypothetical protein [Candidatus Sericytochromatia bacterium]
MSYGRVTQILVLATSALSIAACGIAPMTAPTAQATGTGFQTKQIVPFTDATYFPFAANPVTPWANPLGISHLHDLVVGQVLPTFATAGLGGFGGGYGGYGGFGGYQGYGGGYGGFSPNYPVGGDIFGGATVWNPETGRFDRQPRSLPPGVAEENSESFRPTGSAIWQRK